MLHLDQSQVAPLGYSHSQATLCASRFLTTAPRVKHACTFHCHSFRMTECSGGRQQTIRFDRVGARVRHRLSYARRVAIVT